jgi:hypothetical protein
MNPVDVLTTMANGKIDLGKQLFAVGDFTLAKSALRDAVNNIEMIESLSAADRQQKIYAAAQPTVALPPLQTASTPSTPIIEV